MRQQLVRQRHGLGALKVGVAGHDRVDLGVRPLEQRDRQGLDRAVQIVEQLDGEEAKVERDLIVAAARGVQLSAGGPQAIGERPFDRRVHVLGVAWPYKDPPLDL